jgi:hypothetical protein
MNFFFFLSIVVFTTRQIDSIIKDVLLLFLGKIYLSDYIIFFIIFYYLVLYLKLLISREFIF